MSGRYVLIVDEIFDATLCTHDSHLYLPGCKSLQRLSAAISGLPSAHTETGRSACAQKFPRAAHFTAEAVNFKKAWCFIEVRPWHFWRPRTLGAQACPTSCKYKKFKVVFVWKKVVLLWKADSYGRLTRVEG